MRRVLTKFNFLHSIEPDTLNTENGKSKSADPMTENGRRQAESVRDWEPSESAPGSRPEEGCIGSGIPVRVQTLQANERGQKICLK